MPMSTPEAHRDYQRLWQRRKRARRRRIAREVLGDTCSDCGTRENLETHHIDPAAKEFDLFSGPGLGASKTRWLAELEKCIPLCRTCHSRLHAEEQRQFTVCQVASCERDHRAKGLCNTHYEAVRLGRTSLAELSV